MNLVQITVISNTINRGSVVLSHNWTENLPIVIVMHQKMGPQRYWGMANAMPKCLTCRRDSHALNMFIQPMKKIYKQRWMENAINSSRSIFWMQLLVSFSITFCLKFNIHCADNYKLALVGSIGNAARFIFLPITGFLCDKWAFLDYLLSLSQWFLIVFIHLGSVD